ncbi:MAG: Mor transcription activator family protein [Lachnospiraceae bacterium]
MEAKDLEAKDLAGIYKEIADITDMGTAREIHKLLKGQQIIFPQRIYSKEYVRQYIRENYDGHNIRELSKQFGYSDRRIRQILNEQD